MAPSIDEPELMYKCFDDDNGETPIYDDVDEVIEFLQYLDAKSQETP